MNRREFLLGSAAVAATASVRAAGSERTDGTVRIAHCGDPQLGFGFDKKVDKYRIDLERFERVIASVNAAKPDLCFIAGDLCHDPERLDEDWPRLLKLFKVPVAVAPGNHDMGNSLTKANVERFERIVGYEYMSLKVGDWRFLCGNSQYWRPTAEKERQAKYEAWVKDEFAKAKAAGEKVILATHMPPYVGRANEPDTYENCPLALRETRLKAYRRLGARFYLCGHTHSMLARAYYGMTILNAETTCVNFDELPFGYRMFVLRPDGSYDWSFCKIS